VMDFMDFANVRAPLCGEWFYGFMDFANVSKGTTLW